VIAQLDFCRDLVESAEPRELSAACFRYAARLLEEGLRRQRELAAKSPAFEEQLRDGAAELAIRIERLGADDVRDMEHDLDDLDETIMALRGSLSRLAAADHVELSLVSRGGVSLGNWQAGFLFGVTEWAKNRRGQSLDASRSDPAFTTVTGASAGAVNGLAATIEGCRGPNLVARDSLYYRVWVGLGLFGRHGEAGLFPTEDHGASALGLFSDQGLEQTLEKARSYILSGRPRPNCSVDFGFVTTHLDRTESPIHVREDGTPILTTQKLKEKFTVRLDFPPEPSRDVESSQSTVRITNIGPSGALAEDQIYYAGLGHSRDVSLSSLLRAVQASGAFPAAFPPVPLPYTQYVPGPDESVVPRKRVATFIDGGVLDNTPVGLAVSLDTWRDIDAPKNAFLEGLIPPEPRTYVFLEPGVTSWVGRDEEGGASGVREKDILKLFVGFAGDLLATSMDAQLANTAEQYRFMRRDRADWVEPRLSVPERHMPITGAQFANFMAFLERDFRIFDFHVGMADGFEYLEGESCVDAQDRESCAASAEVVALDAALKASNPLYSCIRAHYESEAFRLLERISTDELPAECDIPVEARCAGEPWQDSEESVSDFLRGRSVLSTSEPDQCTEEAISNHNFRVLLAGMHNYKVWMQSDEYSKEREFDEFFRELGRGERSERFIYVDLPTYQESDDGYLDSQDVQNAFRSLMQDGIDQLAAEQEGTSRAVLRLGGRAGADIAYQRDYPRRILGLGVAVNGLEGTFGQRIGGSKWRWDSTFRYFRIQEQSFRLDLSAWTSEIYLSAQATWIASPSRFIDLELGAGWALGETFAYNGPSPGHVVLRTGPRSYVALVALQRLYLAVNVDYYPFMDVESAYRFTVAPVTRNWELNISGGWRFLF
jgi:predicted acylesterase/phospholipase RssA